MENKDLTIINKTDIEAIASTLLSKLESGYVNPLSILTTVKTYEKVFEKIKKELINYSLTEASKYNEKEFELITSGYDKSITKVNFLMEKNSNLIFKTIEKIDTGVSEINSLDSFSINSNNKNSNEIVIIVSGHGFEQFISNSKSD